MRKAQGSLEYLILIVAVLIVAALAVYLSSTSAGGQTDVAMVTSCKQAATTCKILLRTNANDPCNVCDVQCLDPRTGRDIFSNTDGCGAACSMCKEGDVAMMSQPVAAFDVPCCTYGRACTVDGSPSSDPILQLVGYDWVILGTALSGQTVQYTADALVGGYMSLTVTNSQGGTDSVEKTIVINAAPNPEITPKPIVNCQPILGGPTPAPVTPAPSPTGTYKSFCLSSGNNVDPDNSGVTYSWTCGNGQTGDGSMIICSYACPGLMGCTFQKTVTLTVTETGGCGETTTDTIICTESGCADA